MVATLNNFFEKKYAGLILFTAFWLLSFFLYLPAMHAMLIDDGVNAIYDIKQQGIGGLLHSYHFDSFYHGYYLLLNILYYSFGLHPLGWFLFFSFIHALNSLLCFKIVFEIAETGIENTNRPLVALFASLLFLLSPYQAENIVWAATTHYIISMCIMLYSILLLIAILKSGKLLRIPIWFLLINIFALLTFELSFVFPLVYLLLYLLYYYTKRTTISFQIFFLKVLTPLGFSIACYFLLLHLFKHTLIPHAGASAVAIHSAPELISQMAKLILKLFGYVHYLDNHSRESIYAWCIHWKKISLMAALLIGILGWLAKRKSVQTLYILLFFLLSGLIILLPFSIRFFNILFRYENHRFTYFASVFLYAALVWVLFSIHKWIRFPVLIGILGLHILFVYRTVKDKRASAKLYHQYISTFPAIDSGKTYLLNVPCFSNQSYMFWDRSRLPIALYCYRNIAALNNLEQVLFYNAVSNKDTFDVNKLNDSTWTFQLKTDGSWLMNEYVGAEDYENEHYRVDVGEWGNYTLQFKRKLSSGEKVIYFNGKAFESVR